jgi:hypothetical protein
MNSHWHTLCVYMCMCAYIVLFLHADTLHASLPAIAEVRSGVSMSPEPLHQPLNLVIVTHAHTVYCTNSMIEPYEQF